MAKTKLSHRVFSLSLALLFLVTSLGFSILVIWQLTHNKNSDQSSQQAKENTLEGTKLNNFEPVANIDKLQSIDLKEGTGEVVKPGATVTAHYTGAVAATGIIFQSSHDGQNQPVDFGLDEVIKGWTDGVPGIKVGGTRRLLIPAAQGYGADPPPGSGIPANAGLVFDIEIVSAQNP